MFSFDDGAHVHIASAERTWSEQLVDGKGYEAVPKKETCRVVTFDEYTAVLFRDDVWHAGGCYPGRHWRCHYYIAPGESGDDDWAYRSRFPQEKRVTPDLFRQ